MKNLLTVFFSQRTPQLTTEEIQEHEKRLRITEERFWGPEGAIRFLTVHPDGSISTRGQTQREKLTDEFESTKSFVETPALTASCLYDDGSTVSLGVDDALALRSQIETQPNFLIFYGVDNSSGIDTGIRAINNDMVKGYGFQGSRTFVYSKEPFGPGKDSCISVLPYSQERFLEILKDTGMDFDRVNYGMDYATNIRPADISPNPV